MGKGGFMYCRWAACLYQITPDGTTLPLPLERLKNSIPRAGVHSSLVLNAWDYPPGMYGQCDAWAYEICAKWKSSFRRSYEAWLILDSCWTEQNKGVTILAKVMHQRWCTDPNIFCSSAHNWKSDIHVRS